MQCVHELRVPALLQKTRAIVKLQFLQRCKPLRMGVQPIPITQTTKCFTPSLMLVSCCCIDPCCVTVVVAWGMLRAPCVPAMLVHVGSTWNLLCKTKKDETGALINTGVYKEHCCCPTLVYRINAAVYILHRPIWSLWPPCSTFCNVGCARQARGEGGIAKADRWC